MEKADALEAAPIMDIAMVALISAAPTRGRPGSDLRSACNYLRSYAAVLIQNNEVGGPLARCFDRAINTGISRKQLSYVRAKMADQAPSSVGALMIKNSIIQMTLAAEGRVIADMTFKTRQEVEQLKLDINSAFAEAEEIAADDMDQMRYRKLTALHASIIYHLIETAYPLPRMIKFRFASPMPTLQMAQRLYYDAGRADELRAENYVVHPAFMKREGQALSA